jgi:hypothetical protein
VQRDSRRCWSAAASRFSPNAFGMSWAWTTRSNALGVAALTGEMVDQPWGTSRRWAKRKMVLETWHCWASRQVAVGDGANDLP